MLTIFESVEDCIDKHIVLKELKKLANDLPALRDLGELQELDSESRYILKAERLKSQPNTIVSFVALMISLLALVFATPREAIGLAYCIFIIIVIILSMRAIYLFQVSAPRRATVKIADRLILQGKPQE